MNVPARLSVPPRSGFRREPPESRKRPRPPRSSSHEPARFRRSMPRRPLPRRQRAIEAPPRAGHPQVPALRLDRRCPVLSFGALPGHQTATGHLGPKPPPTPRSASAVMRLRGLPGATPAAPRARWPLGLAAGVPAHRHRTSHLRSPTIPLPPSAPNRGFERTVARPLFVVDSRRFRTGPRRSSLALDGQALGSPRVAGQSAPPRLRWWHEQHGRQHRQDEPDRAPRPHREALGELG